MGPNLALWISQGRTCDLPCPASSLCLWRVLDSSSLHSLAPPPHGSAGSPPNQSSRMIGNQEDTWQIIKVLSCVGSLHLFFYKMILALLESKSQITTSVGEAGGHLNPPTGLVGMYHGAAPLEKFGRFSDN